MTAAATAMNSSRTRVVDYAPDFGWTGRSSHEAVRIFTIDAQPLLRAGLAAVIEAAPGLAVAGEAASGHEALRLIRECRPDVITLDLYLPDMPGDELIRRIVAESRHARILVLTSAQGDVHAARALEAGAAGFLWKGMANQDLVQAIRQVHAGKKAIPKHVALKIAEHVANESLTARETEVLRLVARGNRNKDVAAQLCIADETVRMHMKNILSKLAANDRTHAVTIAVTRGMFEL